MHLGSLGLSGDVEGMLRHSFDYLDLLSTVVIGWQWLLMAGTAQDGLKNRPESASFYQGLVCAARYWIRTEVPRVAYLADLCKSGEDSYATMQKDWY